MKIYFAFLIITYNLVFHLLIFPQNKVEKIENGFSIEVNFEEPNFIDKPNGILTLRDYPDFTDASQTGKFKLPSKTYLIAIPPYSKPNVKITKSRRRNY